MSDRVYALQPGEPKSVQVETMLLLCSEIARKRDLRPFLELPEHSRARLLRDAKTMCAAWSADEALRASYIPGKSAIVDLVVELHRMAEAMVRMR